MSTENRQFKDDDEVSYQHSLSMCTMAIQSAINRAAQRSVVTKE